VFSSQSIRTAQRTSGEDLGKRGISAALTLFLQVIMQAEMDFLGQRFGTGVFEKADGLF
jgi:hypothetical protein